MEKVEKIKKVRIILFFGLVFPMEKDKPVIEIAILLKSIRK